MKFVALVSGGKDSIYSILECQQLGHELVAAVHLGKPAQVEEESYMYQTAGSEVMPMLVEECLGVPLILYQRKGRSINTSLVYQESNDHKGDEVEDLYQALLEAKDRHPEIEAVSSGAILSTYQRVRVESVCQRLGLTSLSFLWRRSTQHDLLRSMIADGVDAVVVRASAPPGLVPRRHLGKTLAELEPHFHQFYDRYQFHVCGEGGEYESLVIDCPLYRRRLVLDETVVVESDDGTGVLEILKCHTEEKADYISTVERTEVSVASTPVAALPTLAARPPFPAVTYVPAVCRLSGGLWHVSEIMSPSPAVDATKSEVELAVEEALAAFGMLRHVLAEQDCTTEDVMMVHLYLSEISHFSAINEHYREVFGTLLPSSRSCVGVGRGVLPGGRRVLLDCVVQAGSGDYMRDRPGNPYADAARATTTAQLRLVLHVQSLSHWAPVCVGPYSQVNTYRSGLHWVAGQIGLVPSTMKLRATWSEQLEQAWTNLASIVDALDGCDLDHLLLGLVYIATPVYQSAGAVEMIRDVCSRERASNGGVRAGGIDGMRVQSIDLDGYEDEETMTELGGMRTRERTVCPLLVVSIPEMPVGALVEVEAVAATTMAASCLSTKQFRRTTLWNGPSRADQWRTGHDFGPKRPLSSHGVRVDSRLLTLGSGSVASAVLVASFSVSGESSPVDCSAVLGCMIDLVSDQLESSKNAPSGCCCLHLRLYYVSNRLHESKLNDGTTLRSAVNAAAARMGRQQAPAITTVPVDGICLLDDSDLGVESMATFLALQAFFVDPVAIETDLWIHHGR